VRPFEEIERSIGAAQSPAALLGLAEEVLERWVSAKGESPTAETSEGFRLLALHRQGARGVPSFHACRETCREIAWHYNLLTLHPEEDAAQRLQMMRLLVTHLALFVRGKLEVEKLGEFCCSARPLRLESPATREGDRARHG
jgi:hypothetical protein